jgi:predicted CXXCH cytochrome family protein
MSTISREACRALAFVVLAVGAAAAAAAEQAPAAARDECVACHALLPDARHAAPAKAFGEDVHRQRGFTCVECHGGDSTVADAARAKAPGTGFRGVPRGAAQVAVCARCHSDAALMRRFVPRQRVDQATEYAASVHGQRLAAGDMKVATCASCHGAHGIRVATDARSPVFPTNVAATCATCHSNPSHMAGYQLPDGSPLPTTQRAEYERSEHYAAMVKRNDLSAPTCNDCHGNHGAAPPGVDAVSNVCGTCHAVFAARFAVSKHAPIFDKACVECHGNHAVLAASDEMLGTASTTSCASCHTGDDDPGFTGAAAMRAAIDELKGDVERVTALIEDVRTSGMEVGEQELALGEARNHLVLARTEVHAFDPATLRPIVSEGRTMLAEIERAGRNALAELQFRRRGLGLSLGVILVVVIALGIKIRRLDRASETRAKKFPAQS